MNVAVLCGGKGTRLGYDGQKCCVPVNGRPFLLHRLDQLVRGGATSFHLLVSHEAEEVFSVVGHWRNDIPLNFIYDDGNGPWEAVRAATRYINAKSFWVANGDTYLEEPLKGRTTPLMVVTPYLVEPANVEPNLLDAGLYHVAWRDPVPTSWQYRMTMEQPYTMNTPKQLEDLCAYLRG